MVIARWLDGGADSVRAWPRHQEPPTVGVISVGLVVPGVSSEIDGGAGDAGEVVVVLVVVPGALGAVVVVDSTAGVDPGADEGADGC